MADKTPYGPASEAHYADPGYQDDGVKRYPLDSEEHCRAAWAYINMPKNAAKYSPDELKKIKGRIQEALKKYGVQVSETADASQGQMAVGVESPDETAGALLASVAPLAPPASWFADPKLQAPTKLTITDEGRVFGHLARWKVCHVGIGNACVMAPKSRMNYQLFRVGSLHTGEGTSVDVGKIVLGTAHANERWGVMPTRDHYDNTGLAAAVVNVGEDRHGIWVSGALTTNMTPEKIAELRASALSGDWRVVNGNLELIAALAVNSPGFPIYREQSGHAFSLMAVGVVDDTQEEPVTESGEFSAEFPADDVVDNADELALRLQRLEEIDNDLESYNRDRRLAQLAAIDEERMALAEKHAVPVGAVSPTNLDDQIFIQYNARFQALQETQE
jgi:Family of unknown function (DUF6582)